MTDTKFADVSKYQRVVDDTYPYAVIEFRSNDGTYRDENFAANLAWAKHACDTGKLVCFLVYFVFEENWQQTVETFKQMVGKPHPLMAVTVDVESWGGKITGDHSDEINACRAHVAGWLRAQRSAWGRAVDHITQRSRKRVVGYGNAGDLAAIWPRRKGARIILANYSSNPDFPGKIAHQYANNENTPPFGPCDINSADGLTPQQFAAALGLSAPAAPKPRHSKPKHRWFWFRGFWRGWRKAHPHQSAHHFMKGNK